MHRKWDVHQVSQEHPVLNGSESAQADWNILKLSDKLPDFWLTNNSIQEASTIYPVVASLAYRGKPDFDLISPKKATIKKVL